MWEWNSIQRFARGFARQPWVMRGAGVVLPAERFLRRVTGGRFGVLDIGGLPSIQITVVGRKSGLERTTSLLCVPDGDGFLLVGSNWGRPEHPAWSANLRAATTATAVYKGSAPFKVSVTEFTGVERKRYWDQVVEFWPGYEMEAGLAQGREFRIFRLARV
ncbi:nitroreductase family deazaflavin-dependent oxidoreductase [Nocardia camponoti]|uniref:Nitroreductase n=1 Tax=Nocardia camponoti TaxID=1616106 RepID=A0A917Q8X0_9NOCA|nr:nitroreductase family deazaflavin-dependent oxidoreductase [Nocardia camponoti]GGK35187.1 nitroreductase [Nocardia camponoti]